MTRPSVSSTRKPRAAVSRAGMSTGRGDADVRNGARSSSCSPEANRAWQSASRRWRTARSRSRRWGFAYRSVQMLQQGGDPAYGGAGIGQGCPAMRVSMLSSCSKLSQQQIGRRVHRGVGGGCLRSRMRRGQQVGGLGQAVQQHGDHHRQGGLVRPADTAQDRLDRFATWRQQTGGGVRTSVSSVAASASNVATASASGR